MQNNHSKKLPALPTPQLVSRKEQDAIQKECLDEEEGHISNKKIQVPAKKPATVNPVTKQVAVTPITTHEMVKPATKPKK